MSETTSDFLIERLAAWGVRRVHMATTAAQVRHLVDRAIPIAKAERTHGTDSIEPFLPHKS